MKKTLTLVGVAGLAATVMLTGCSNNKADSTPSSSTSTSGSSASAGASGSAAPTASSSPVQVTVPATVTGAKWCAPVYKTYAGEAASPSAAAEQLTSSAQLAKEEGKTSSADALTALADFLKNNASAASLSPDQMTTFQTLDTNVGNAFKADCGGKTLAEVVQAGQPSAPTSNDPAQPQGQ